MLMLDFTDCMLSLRFHYLGSTHEVIGKIKFSCTKNVTVQQTPPHPPQKKIKEMRTRQQIPLWPLPGKMAPHWSKFVCRAICQKCTNSPFCLNDITVTIALQLQFFYDKVTGFKYPVPISFLSIRRFAVFP